MKIPFIKVKSPQSKDILKYFELSVESGQFSNFGPNEQDLTSRLESKIGSAVICAANATLIIDGLHHILSNICKTAYLPGWTFPATNLGCRIPYSFGKTIDFGDKIGFSEFNIKGSEISYAITTAPFGAEKPEKLSRPDNTTFWIVDNAAGTSPDMHKVRDWIKAGADAVVCSMHATKILSACEGGFVAFNNNFLYDSYRKYVVFGYYLNKNSEKDISNIGSNHKLSEINSAYALAYMDSCFENEYKKRIELSREYSKIFEKKDLQFINSPQAFWIKTRSYSHRETIVKNLLECGIETRPYYTPLFDQINIDPGAELLSKTGLCLPTWGMSKIETEYVLEQLVEKVPS